MGAVPSDMSGQTVGMKVTAVEPLLGPHGSLTGVYYSPRLEDEARREIHSPRATQPVRDRAGIQAQVCPAPGCPISVLYVSHSPDFSGEPSGRERTCQRAAPRPQPLRAHIAVVRAEVLAKAVSKHLHQQ